MAITNCILSFMAGVILVASVDLARIRKALEKLAEQKGKVQP
jgi:hypothetical protein